jgi:hypothetical protein
MIHKNFYFNLTCIKECRVIFIRNEVRLTANVRGKGCGIMGIIKLFFTTYYSGSIFSH